MSTFRLIVSVLLSVALHAQATSGGAGFPLTGEIRSEGATHLGDLEVQLYDRQNNTVVDRVFVSNDGSFRFNHVTAGSYTVRITASPGDEPILQEDHQIGVGGSPLVLQLREQPKNSPVSGIVSLRELAHPLSKRAVHAAIEAQQFSQAHDVPRAIAKLEEAIRIDPAYRDAHMNLGAQYARAGRVADALTQFRQALDIGPADAIIYSNLCWAYAALREFAEAEKCARKALTFDAKNVKAHYLLGRLLSMQPGQQTEAQEHLKLGSGQ